MRLTLLLITILGLGILLVAACSTEGIERAKAQEREARVREVAAPYAGEVAVINAETDALLKELQTLEDHYKSRSLFDAQLLRNDFATIVLEFQALNNAIRGETEAARQATAELEEVAERADGVGHNALAAADNSWVAAWALGIFGVLLLGLTATLIVFCAKFERRLASLEKEK